MPFHPADGKRQPSVHRVASIVADGEADMIEQFNDALTATSDPQERRTIRILKAVMPVLHRAMLAERDLGIKPQDLLGLVQNLAHSILATMCSTVTQGDEGVSLMVQAMILDDIRATVRKELGEIVDGMAAARAKRGAG